MPSFVKTLSHSIASVSTHPVESRSGYFIGVSKTLYLSVLYYLLPLYPYKIVISSNRKYIIYSINVV
ncbi:hypothetical protein PQZ67_gp32 [Escherichia phage ZCEC13]|uniref:hypothetical protein n=1 Tax=Escherichia phage ZCEC13 TaxID=2935866 RepID=UPI00233EBCA2|nr:hypothetical protein PQZ67_gp32 [Escherichia phage ZCEC13]